jgi:hypothetical protein
VGTRVGAGGEAVNVAGGWVTAGRFTVPDGAQEAANAKAVKRINRRSGFMQKLYSICN